MRRRGFTLVEVVLCTALTAMVVGVVAMLYAFTIGRMAHATTNFATMADAVAAANAVADTVTNANSCSTVYYGGKPALKCVMPAAGTDRDNDGRLDAYTFTRMSRRGIERFTQGKRVWFYLSDGTGSIGSTGTVLTRAERSDDLYPSASNVDWRFTEVKDGTSRYGNVSQWTIATDSALRTVSYTITVSTLTRADRLAEASEADRSYSNTQSRTVFWRNWRS